MSNINNIDAKQLKEWLDSGEAVLVDVREPMEFSEWHIPQASSMPLTHIKDYLSNLDGEKRKVVFQCLKGVRGELAAAEALKQFDDKLAIYNLDGGITAWQEAGFAIIRESKEGSIPLIRQVMMAAGGMIFFFSFLALCGLKLGAFISLLMGCGLLYAGLTGKCGLSMLLQKMPWNQKK